MVLYATNIFDISAIIRGRTSSLRSFRGISPRTVAFLRVFSTIGQDTSVWPCWSSPVWNISRSTSKSPSPVGDPGMIGRSTDCLMPYPLVVLVSELSRLDRSIVQIIKLLDILVKREIRFIALKEDIRIFASMDSRVWPRPRHLESGRVVPEAPRAKPGWMAGRPRFSVTSTQESRKRPSPMSSGALRTLWLASSRSGWARPSDVAGMNLQGVPFRLDDRAHLVVAASTKWILSDRWTGRKMSPFAKQGPSVFRG